MTFLEEAKARGFIHQCTDMVALEELMRKPICAYIGFDCTADSLHVGSLMQLMILRLLQKYGHRPIVLVGDATTKIGDPSGKDQSRRMLSDDEINTNTVGIKNCLLPFLQWEYVDENHHFHDNLATIVHNLDWCGKLDYLSLLREVGHHFTINRMLTMDSVKIRLEKENPMTFLEFNYMILQSYDFMYLNKVYDVSLQIGGSDQWGNITSGIDLVRRCNQRQAFGLTTPLIETASGEKMGKSVSGAVWLSKDKTPIYDYWQFWRNTDDKDVERFLKMFTDLSINEINEIMLLQNINEAKHILADQATTIAHGVDWKDKMREQDWSLDHGILEKGIPARSLFFMVGLATSNADARRLIQQNGAKINDITIAEDRIVTLADVLPERNAIKLSAGQKRVKFVVPL